MFLIFNNLDKLYDLLLVFCLFRVFFCKLVFKDFFFFSIVLGIKWVVFDFFLVVFLCCIFVFLLGMVGFLLLLLFVYIKEFLGGFLGGIGGFFGILLGFFIRVIVCLGGVGNFFVGLVDLIFLFWWIFVGGGGVLGRFFIFVLLDLLGFVMYFFFRYLEELFGKRKFFCFNGGSGLFLIIGGGVYVLF